MEVFDFNVSSSVPNVTEVDFHVSIFLWPVVALSFS